MKYLMILLTALTLSACGESGTPQQRLEKNLSKLVKACKNTNGDYSGAAGLVVYTGSDRERKYKDLASAEGDDRQILNSTCYKISKLMEGGNSYTLMKYETEKESEGTWHVQHIKFPANEKVVMAFLDVDGVMALADIDS